MKLTGSRADKYCAGPPADSLGALFFGPDRGLVRERADSLARAFCDNPDDAFGVTLLTADDLAGDIGKLADEMAAQSMFGDQRLIRLRLDHERQASAISKMILEFDRAPQRCAARLIVEAGDMQSKSLIRKTFEAAKSFAAVPCYEANAREIEGLIKDGLAACGEFGVGITPDALSAFAPLLEGDRALAKGEIEKMALYKGYGAAAGERVTLEDITALAAGAGSADLDDIIYAAFSGDSLGADDAYRRAVDGKVAPALILRSISRHLTRLHAAISAMDGGASTSEALRALRPPVFGMRQSQFERQMQIWRLPALSRAISESLETDKRVKSAGSAAESLTGRFLLAISAQAARKRR